MSPEEIYIEVLFLYAELNKEIITKDLFERRMDHLMTTRTTSLNIK
jgi:hypothetical protein